MIFARTVRPVLDGEDRRVTNLAPGPDDSGLSSAPRVTLRERERHIEIPVEHQHGIESVVLLSPESFYQFCLSR